MILVSVKYVLYLMFQQLLTMKTKDGTGVSLLISIRQIARGRCPALAPTKKSLEEAKIAPFKEPNVEQATKNGIRRENVPNILSLNVTATASDAKISSLLRTTK